MKYVGWVITENPVYSKQELYLSVNATIINDILKAIIHQATIAAWVTLLLWAVHEILLWEGGQSPGGLEICTLRRRSGGEGPAPSALALILDSDNIAFGTPVHRAWICDIGYTDEV